MRSFEAFECRNVSSIIHSNPNNSTDEILAEMNWPKHDSVNEFYLDIGTHLVEKNGLFLERFSVWDRLEINSGRPLRVSLTLIAILLMKFGLQLRSVPVISQIWYFSKVHAEAEGSSQRLT